MTIRDYNGTGKWSRDSITERYKRYAQKAKIASPKSLMPIEHTEGTVHWVYPVMDAVIEAIKAGDTAAIEIGIEFIEENQSFPFGRTLKSQTARALKRAPLSSEQVERIRDRVIQMLLDSYVPREYSDYAKLLRKVGVGDKWLNIEGRINRDDPSVMRYYQYFTHHVIPEIGNGRTAT